MRDDDRDAAALRTVARASSERIFTLAVEVGVRFVEHHQERVAVQRARQSDALSLPGRQHHARTGPPRVCVAVGQDAGSSRARRPPWPRPRFRGRLRPDRTGRCSRRSCRRAATHPAADSRYAAQRFGSPVVDIGVVEPHAAAHERPDAGDGPRQRRLAAAARPDQTQRLPGVQLQADVAEHDRAGAGATRR